MLQLACDGMPQLGIVRCGSVPQGAMAGHVTDKSMLGTVWYSGNPISCMSASRPSSMRQHCMCATASLRLARRMHPIACTPHPTCPPCLLFLPAGLHQAAAAGHAGLQLQQHPQARQHLCAVDAGVACVGSHAGVHQRRQRAAEQLPGHWPGWGGGCQGQHDGRHAHDDHYGGLA